MHPTLFQFWGLSIHTYGVFIALGCLAGIWVASREARRLGEDSEAILDLSFYAIAAAIIGSRLFYVAVNWDAFRGQPLEIFKIWRGGLVFYGGLLAAVPTVIIYLRRHGLRTWVMADILTPALALGQSFGRLGCFSAGCCYGRLSLGGWPAVIFSNPDTLAPQGVPLHPTQLYDSALMLVIFLVLLGVRRRARFAGQTFLTYLVLFTPERIMLEELRADTYKTLFSGTLSLTQLISIVLFVVAAAILILGLRAHPRKGLETAPAQKSARGA
jgi:phosphatidylglycerol:prolipoprotein diacylglycerol transferase